MTAKAASLLCSYAFKLVGNPANFVVTQHAPEQVQPCDCVVAEKSSASGTALSIFDLEQIQASITVLRQGTLSWGRNLNTLKVVTRKRSTPVCVAKFGKFGNAGSSQGLMLPSCGKKAILQYRSFAVSNLSVIIKDTPDLVITS